MSSHSVTQIKHGAIYIANELCTGQTVCLTVDDRWSTNWQDAWVITSEESASSAILLAAKAVADNRVIDPYLVDTSPEGNPTHKRERLRLTGPSVDYLSTTNRKTEAHEYVSLR